MQPLPECVLIVVLASKLHEYAMFAWRHKKWSAHTILLKEGLMHTTQLCKCDFICAICEIYTNITLQLQLNQFKFFINFIVLQNVDTKHNSFVHLMDNYTGSSNKSDMI